MRVYIFSKNNNKWIIYVPIWKQTQVNFHFKILNKQQICLYFKPGSCICLTLAVASALALALAAIRLVYEPDAARASLLSMQAVSWEGVRDETSRDDWLLQLIDMT